MWFIYAGNIHLEGLSRPRKNTLVHVKSLNYTSPSLVRGFFEHGSALCIDCYGGIYIY